MSGSPQPYKFTATDYQQAAAAILAAGSAPAWWGSQLQAIQTSGSVAPPTFQTVKGQQAIATAANAQQAWLAGLTSNRQGTQSSGSTAWVQTLNEQGDTVYVNTMTGEISRVAPGSIAPPITAPTPTVDDVSRYLNTLLSGSGSAAPSDAQLAATAAGSAQQSWISGLNSFRLGSEAVGSYGVGSIPGMSPNFYKSGSAADQGSGRSIRYFDDGNTPTTEDAARGIARPGDINAITYSASINDEPKPNGPITTLLDLTNRDQQENDIFPIRSEITWFTRDTERRILPFTPVVQETALRGPAAFGQRFTFDLGSIMVGDLLLGTALQIRLDHWLDPQTQNIYAAGKIQYSDPAAAWEYANSLGTSMIQLAELEIDGKTIETIDGDFIHTFSALFADYNTQVGIAYDHLGQMSIQRLLSAQRAPALYPVENGNLNCILPFFFMRTRLREALPMISIREGNVKIHITLRPFSQCVRQMRRTRDSCEAVPPPTTTPFTFSSCTWLYDPAVLSGAWDIPPQFSFTQDIAGVRYNWNHSALTNRGNWVTDVPPVTVSIGSSYRWISQAWSPSPPPFNVAYQDPILKSKYYYWDDIPQEWRHGPLDAGPPAFDFTYGDNTWSSKVGDWSVAAPPFRSVQLLTYGAIVDGPFRSKMLYNPFEILHRQVQTFSFDEPLKYSIGKRNDSDRIRIQLPLEANHPLEEILWFVRRKGVAMNNEWTNYTGILESEWPATAAQAAAATSIPLLQNAIIQVNGTVLCDADEQFYREGIAAAHRGGYAAYSRFIYGYSFAKTPGEHQPSGSMNASRLNSLRLVLDVKPPGGLEDGNWEVKVFCIGLNWLRFENGLANPMFED